ncbi:hypothetical protein CICLE_v10030434mg [Citrus x clementina]|uniref:Uncharacterized protein n=1 Tax=Citrus clementina TaxID=85681 RepID=V4SE44_CITCL|nr:hypothetical protein CICLE_v10030434mg [Citrus x clementina]
MEIAEEPTSVLLARLLSGPPTSNSSLCHFMLLCPGKGELVKVMDCGYCQANNFHLLCDLQPAHPDFD